MQNFCVIHWGVLEEGQFTTFTVDGFTYQQIYGPRVAFPKSTLYMLPSLTPWLLPEMNGAVLQAILGVIWVLEERVHITCILFLAIIYKSICQKCRNFLDVLHIYSQHKFLQLSAICNNRKTENCPLSNCAYRYNRFQHNNNCLNSNAKHNYRNDLDCQIKSTKTTELLLPVGPMSFLYGTAWSKALGTMSDEMDTAHTRMWLPYVVRSCDRHGSVW